LASVTLLLSLNVRLARAALEHPRGHLNYTLIIWSAFHGIFSLPGDRKCRQEDNKGVRSRAGVYISFLDFFEICVFLNEINGQDLKF